MARRLSFLREGTQGGDNGTEGTPRDGSATPEVAGGASGANEETGYFDPASVNAPGENGSGEGSGSESSGGQESGGGSGSGESEGWWGRRKQRKRKAAKTENLEAILLSAHNMLAAFADTPELELADEEAKKIAEGIQRVQKLYNYNWISDEAAAWGNLIFALGSVYGPRYMAIRLRWKKEEEEARLANARHIHTPASAG